MSEELYDTFLSKSSISTLNPVRDVLKDSGYRQFNSDFERRYKYCDVMFQKTIRDTIGKKYFVTLYGYGPRPEHQLHHWRWADEVNVNEPHMTFQQHSLSLDKETLALVEERAETFWQAMGQPYYERYNEVDA